MEEEAPLIGKIIGGILIAGVIVGGFLYTRNYDAKIKDLEQNGQITQGKITTHDLVCIKDRYTIRYRYEVEGKVYQHINTFDCDQKLPEHLEIEVVYWPDNPQNSRILFADRKGLRREE